MASAGVCTSPRCCVRGATRRASFEPYTGVRHVHTKARGTAHVYVYIHNGRWQAEGTPDAWPRCNLLLLDEPSNDLDVDTLRSLEEALHDFAGSAIIVSHDRWFLDRVCTHTLAFEQSSAQFYDGPVSAYYEWQSRYGG